MKAAVCALGVLQGGVQFSPHFAHALWEKGKKQQVETLGLEAGVRLFTHYNRVILLSTPPESLIGEVQFNYYPTAFVGVYALFGKGVSGAATTLAGGGLKINTWRIVAPKGVVSELVLQLLFDFTRFSVPPPTGAQVYSETEWIPRGGIGTRLRFLATRFFLDAQIMGARPSGNLFAGPYLGAGFSI